MEIIEKYIIHMHVQDIPDKIGQNITLESQRSYSIKMHKNAF